MKKMNKILAFLICNLYIMSNAWAVKIGIILPVSHPALEEIVKGFKEKIVGQITSQDQVIVKNAQGDLNLQYQIIQQLQQENVDYFLPISTGTALMTLSLVKNKPVIAIAAEISPTSLRPDQPVGIVCDEINPEILLQFIRKGLPEVKKIGVMYANSERNEKPIKTIKDFCDRQELTLQLRKIDAFSELIPAAQSVIPEVDAIIILKDNLIVSGLSVLINTAKKHKKLLIAMDDASVKQGAHMALAVPEQIIGNTAAQHLAAAFQENLKEAYGATTLVPKDIFLNKQALADFEPTAIEQLNQAATDLNLMLRWI